MKIRDGYERKVMGRHSMVVKNGASGEKPEILFALNETGAYLWDGIAKGRNSEELLRELMQEYEAGPEVEELIRGDIRDFMEQLQAMGAMEE